MNKPLYEKEFRLKELFDIHTPAKKFNANTVRFGGRYPYVARGSSNNGIRGYITEDTKYLNPANTLSFGQDTATVYYQDKPYFTGDKIKIMELKSHELTESIALYFLPVIRKAFSEFSWGQSSFNESILNNMKIILPAAENGLPDWDYMQEYIAVLERERIKELDAYLKTTGLEDCELTDEEVEVLKVSPEWKEFRIIDIFDVRNTHSILKEWVTFNSGNTPYVTAGEGNNSIASYVACDNAEWLDTGMCVLIGGKTTVITYQEKDFISNDSHNLALYAKSEKVNEYIYRFMVSALQKSLRKKYSWGDSISKKKIQNDYFKLPVLPDGTPDFEYMEKYIKAIEKMAIKDVVEWKDKSIATT